LSDLGVGADPKFKPQSTDGIGEFIGLTELIATRYYMTPYVKYSSRYSRSNIDLFPVVQPEPEMEMTYIDQTLTQCSPRSPLVMIQFLRNFRLRFRFGDRK